MGEVLSDHEPEAPAPNPVVGKPLGHRSQELQALQGERSRLARHHKACAFGDQIEPVESLGLLPTDSQFAHLHFRQPVCQPDSPNWTEIARQNRRNDTLLNLR